mmetsp:Transcript_8532/g.11519  ORF Transcript_8532/g.11519 Transcript_8532/m.11519 type:complete len:618 (+) Transcript_8532:252-2105(+)
MGQNLYSLVFIWVTTIWLAKSSEQYERTGQLSGNIFAINDEKPSTFMLERTIVLALKVHYNKITREAEELTYDQIYRFQTYEHAFGTVEPTTGHFVVNDLETTPESYYALFLFVDENNDRNWNPDILEPCGWNLLPSVSPKPITTHTSEGIVWNISLHSGMKFTDQDMKSVPNGRLAFVRGYPVLHTWGSQTERGYAHGFLLSKQIIQLFRFWLLESTIASYAYYEESVIPFLENGIVIPRDVQAELVAAYAGIVESGTNLYLPELERDFSYSDLLYINNYGVRPFSGGTEDHCSQFSAWGERTNGLGTIAGRNMDGELDIRKTTISLFVIMAVEPEQQQNIPQNRGLFEAEPEKVDEFKSMNGAAANCGKELAYVNFGWPGFISAVTSGFNEMGLHAMINSGFFWQPGPAPKSPKVGMLLNNVLKIMNCPTIGEASGGILPFQEEKVPKFVVGLNILLAQPDDVLDGVAPSVVYEGDRLGGMYRFELDAHPHLSHLLLTTNHFMKYGYTPDDPYANFGISVGHGSWWRYLAGENYFYSLDSAQLPITGGEIERALETVCHGTSEHSIVTFSNQRKFKVGLASVKFSQAFSSYDLKTAPIFDFWDVFIGNSPRGKGI